VSDLFKFHLRRFERMTTNSVTANKLLKNVLKLFLTGSVTVVTDCQKFSHFLPVTYQIDIRTAKFLQKFQSSDNQICNSFLKEAEIGVKYIFSQYRSQIHNVYDLKKIQRTLSSVMTRK